MNHILSGVAPDGGERIHIRGDDVQENVHQEVREEGERHDRGLAQHPGREDLRGPSQEGRRRGPDERGAVSLQDFHQPQSLNCQSTGDCLATRD